MKKFILYILPILIIAGCDEIPTGEVSQKDYSFQVVKISAPDNFVYSSNDSSFITSVIVNSSENVKEINCDLTSPSGRVITSSLVILLDNGDITSGDSTAGDNIFSGKLELSSNDINGSYTISYNAVNTNDQNINVGFHKFNYYNGQQNYPPVISDLVMPDSVTSGNLFNFSVKVFDPNGYEDIKEVYFELYYPDGSLVVDPSNGQSKFFMLDNGDANFPYGDAVANDGIFSFMNSFGSSAKGQIRKFVFHATDRADSLSNTIIHDIYVK